jgi:hypothetical protein
MSGLARRDVAGVRLDTTLDGQLQVSRVQRVFDIPALLRADPLDRVLAVGDG